jgi:hypothetical protein
MQNSSTIPLAEYNFCHYSAIIIYKLLKALIQLFVKYKMLVERFFSMDKDIYRAGYAFELIKAFLMMSVVDLLSKSASRLNCNDDSGSGPLAE